MPSSARTRRRRVCSAQTFGRRWRSDARCTPLRRKWRDFAKNLPCAASTPHSRAVRAAFEESSVAVTAGRFYWPARSREGEGSMKRDGLVERNSLGDAFSEMHAARPQGSPGAAAPGAFWGLFRGEKSPAGGRRKGISLYLLSRLMGPRTVPQHGEGPGCTAKISRLQSPFTVPSMKGRFAARTRDARYLRWKWTAGGANGPA